MKSRPVEPSSTQVGRLGTIALAAVALAVACGTTTAGGSDHRGIPVRAVGSTRAVGRLPKVLACNDKAELRPRSFVIACADANTYLEHITWRSWTGSGATGSGIYIANTCRPTCVAGTFTHIGATVRLSDPRTTARGRLFGLLVVERVEKDKTVVLNRFSFTSEPPFRR